MENNAEKKIADGLRSIYRGLDLFHEELLQLSPKELAFLLILEETGGCRVKDLAARVNLPLSTVSWTADRMVNKKFISRKTDPSDRRAILLSLATQGRAALNMHRKIFDDVAHIVAGNMTPEELSIITGLIEKISTFFKQTS